MTNKKPGSSHSAHLLVTREAGVTGANLYICMNELHYYFPAPSLPVVRLVEVDVCVYGASPGAIAAAIQTKRSGRSVALVVNAARLGGLTSGGLGNTDIGNKQSIGGLAREFYRRVGHHYGVAEEWRFEPKVAELAFWKMVDEAGVMPWMREFPKAVIRDGARLKRLECESGLAIQARQFIDASYEGDLMALAGVSHRIGREGNALFGETFNGVQFHSTHQFDFAVDPYVIPGNPASGLLPGIEAEPPAPIGTGDRKVQAYNFRMCLTQAQDRIRFPKPEGYDPRDYELLARYLKTGWSELFKKFDPIRGQKTDTNNHGAVSTDFIGGSWNFPAGSWIEREEIFQAHVRWQQGLMWFLANDERVSARWRHAVGTWGLAADEFTATGGWPPQLYIREARRLETDYCITEHDCRGRVRAEDGVGLGAYAMDSHNCQRVVINGCVRNEGDVQASGFPPYPVSYRALTPRRQEAVNLLVPVCLSASHIAYGSVRMEPVFMILGQSAAFAADLALAREIAVQDVPYRDLRIRLEAAGQITAWPVEGAPQDGAVVYEPEAPPPDSTAMARPAASYQANGVS